MSDFSPDPADVNAPFAWQQSQWDTLQRALQDNHLPHAILVGALAGTGKRHFSRAFAHRLLCEQPEAGVACGHCRQCGFTRAGTHPDLKWVEPEEKGKQIRVDQIREVVEFLSHTAQQGGYKICVVYPAENMNVNAANALLKSLEEPAGNALLLLLSDAPSRLMATIRSRCQHLRLDSPTPQQSEAWLAGRIGDQQALAELLTEFRRQPLRALEYFQSESSDQYQQWERAFLDVVSGVVSPVAVAQDWQQQDLAELLQWLFRRLSGLIAASMSGADISPSWRDLVGRAGAAGLFAVLDQIQALNQQLSAGGNPNRQLAIENLLLVSCDKFHN